MHACIVLLELYGPAAAACSVLNQNQIQNQALQSLKHSTTKKAHWCWLTTFLKA